MPRRRGMPATPAGKADEPVPQPRRLLQPGHTCVPALRVSAEYPILVADDAARDVSVQIYWGGLAARTHALTNGYSELFAEQPDEITFADATRSHCRPVFRP